MTEPRRIPELLAVLARGPEGRGEAARALARELNAEDLLVLTFEKEHSVYLPARGFPQTLFEGRRWKAFAQGVAAESHWVAELCYPTANRERTARGWLTPDGAILILFDGAPNADRVQCLLTLLSLVTPTFEKERLLVASTAKEKLSAQAAQQATELAESLDDVRRQLQATVMLREQDIAERERVEKQLEQSNLDLKRVNDDLSQFTFAATHDIREPLRMVSIYVQLLERELQGQLTETTRGYMQQVTGGAQRIAQLIDGLLQFTRLGEMDSIEPVPVEAGAALEEALEDLRMNIAENHATVHSAALPVVMADPLHLRQLFQNLVGNALKYRRRDTNPDIRIGANREGFFWLFAVRDNGIGIAPEYHEQIFLPFKRLHSSEITGAGIGLATCKRIVERYGGRIWVASAPQRGSEFCFSLPAA